PGTLPRLNEEVVNYGMKAAMALNCDIASETIFDRKHYFYPDSPAAYQISQDKQPIGENGWIDIEVDGEQKRIGIERIHLEEDRSEERRVGKECRRRQSEDDKRKKVDAQQEG